MADYPSDRRYTKDHEWAQPDGVRVRVGISKHAVDQLGDVTLVNVDVAVGVTLAAGKAFGTVESVKAVSDLFAPIGGKVVEINAALATSPEILNDDSYGKGWMIAIEPSDNKELDALMDGPAYAAFVAMLDH